MAKSSFSLALKKDTLRKREKKQPSTNRVRFLHFQTITSLVVREHMKEKWGTNKERTSNSWKTDRSPNVFVNPILWPSEQSHA